MVRRRNRNTSAVVASENIYIRFRAGSANERETTAHCTGTTSLTHDQPLSPWIVAASRVLSRHPIYQKRNTLQGPCKTPSSLRKVVQGKITCLMSTVINHCLCSLTSNELLRHAELSSRDAALRAREADLMRLEADLLRREAHLKQREESQDAAERLAFMGPDNSAFWNSLNDQPSDDESAPRTSISSSPPLGPTTIPEPNNVGVDTTSDSFSDDESDLTTSTFSSRTLCTPSTPPATSANRPGTHLASRGPSTTPGPTNVRKDRVYQVASPSRQGLTATWCGVHILPSSALTTL